VISRSLAVRQELGKFELGQIWIEDRTIRDKADAQWQRMKDAFDTVSIPLHTIVAPDGTHLARFTYAPTMSPDDYLRFLARGEKKYALWKERNR
jgi:hypothetical protein